jgi:hypothetical protein
VRGYDANVYPASQNGGCVGWSRRIKLEKGRNNKGGHLLNSVYEIEERIDLFKFLPPRLIWAWPDS